MQQFQFDYKHMYLIFAIIQHMNFSNFKCEIFVLRVENYKLQKEIILVHLGLMNINYAIQKDEPHSITETSLPNDYDRHEMWK